MKVPRLNFFETQCMCQIHFSLISNSMNNICNYWMTLKSLLKATNDNEMRGWHVVAELLLLLLCTCTACEGLHMILLFMPIEQQRARRLEWELLTRYVASRSLCSTSSRYAPMISATMTAVRRHGCQQIVWFLADRTWTLPASLATSADVLVRRGWIGLYAYRRTHLPTWEYCDPSCRRLSPSSSIHHHHCVQ